MGVVAKRRVDGMVRCFLASTAINFIALLAVSEAMSAELPPGFVYLREAAPAILQDMRYAGPHNFTGKIVAGYEASECILTRPAAAALARAQQLVAAQGLKLIVWDCYRPRRAVADFVRWARNADTRMKAEFYPAMEKSRLFALGYIAAHSAHSRGSTVDLGLVPAGLAAVPVWDGARPLVSCAAAKGVRMEDGTIDLGTGFDCFDERAHVRSRAVAAAARTNRKILHDAMASAGFVGYPREWWHFKLADEPFPDRAFDFQVRPRTSP